MSITKMDVDQLIQIVQKLYLEDSIPWVIGYSGGKDSTATLQLVWMAMQKLPEERRTHKPIHVISTDTLVESPVVAKWVERSLDKIEAMAEQEKLPFVKHRLTPDYNDTFWVNLLGRGYPYPRPSFRWCTERLKIKPANQFVQNVVSQFGEVILLLGTRKAESASRARTMRYYEQMRVRDYLSPNGSMQNELIFSPLENWSDDDVWTFLMQYKNPWGHSNKELLTLYRGATADGECPLVMSTDTPSCGKSRFGCWVCTMVEKDKSMAAMIMNDAQKEWMSPLLELRNEIGASKPEDYARRDFRRMTGNVLLHKDRLVPGPYLKEMRESWLRKLLSVQTEIQENGPEEFRSLELITQEELNLIRQIWLNEKHEFDDALPRIYEEATGRPFIAADEGGDSFGEAEWTLLSAVCTETYPEEKLLLELTARIVDIERQATESNKRRGVVAEVSKQLKRGFFRNADDALEFAQARERRRGILNGTQNVLEGAAQLNLFEAETEEKTGNEN